MNTGLSVRRGRERARIKSYRIHTYFIMKLYKKRLVRAGVVGVGSGIFSKFLKIRENFVKISGKMYGDTKMGKEHYITAKQNFDKNPSRQ